MSDFWWACSCRRGGLVSVRTMDQLTRAKYIPVIAMIMSNLRGNFLDIRQHIIRIHSCLEIIHREALNLDFISSDWLWRSLPQKLAYFYTSSFLNFIINTIWKNPQLKAGPLSNQLAGFVSTQASRAPRKHGNNNQHDPSEN